jgi:apolipoprotein N-acyltransferase
MPTSALRALPFALLLGALAACGFAPVCLWPLTIACFVGVVALLESTATLRRALAVGWWFGVGIFAIGNNWIATAFTYQAAMPAWLGWIAVVLLSFYLAVFTAIATGIGWGLARWRGGGLAWFFAGGWIVGEWLRATVFTGFAWNPIAAVWMPARLIPLLTLPWAGTYGLSGLTILLAGALWFGVRALVRSLADAPDRRGGRLFVLTAVVLAIVIGVTSILVPIASAPLPQGDGPRIRVVQPNINQNEKWAEGAELRNFNRLVALTGAPTAEPRLILWPEVAIPWYLENDPAARAALAALLGPHDLMLTGGIAVRTDAQGDIVAATNSLFGLDPAGHLLGRYDKSHLVPYGEYLPMRPILSRLGLSRLAPGDMDFDAGPGPRDFILPGIGFVGGQICYEIIFSGQVIDAGHRPRFLFNPSNDAWFGAWGPPQHLAQARLRAIEEGMPIVRSTPTGISAVIDAQGRLLARVPYHEAGAIDSRLPALAAPTLFARFGNLLPGALAILLGLAGFASGLRRR